MSPVTSSKMFLSGAIFNWVIALGLFFIPASFLSLFFVTPAPEQTLWVQQFAGLVFFFGCGYYGASRDFDKYVELIRLAVWGKTGVVLIALLNVTRGDISWQFMIPASGDAIYAMLFILALKSRSRWSSGSIV